MFNIINVAMKQFLLCEWTGWKKAETNIFK